MLILIFIFKTYKEGQSSNEQQDKIFLQVGRNRHTKGGWKEVNVPVETKHMKAVSTHHKSVSDTRERL